jgi:SAM-dependent methyltransferase
MALETPHRLRDAFFDLRDGLTSLEPLPPATLRARVGWTSSRREFLSVGKAACSDLLSAALSSGAAIADLRDWLDFGCGPGRIARHVLDAARPGARLTGLDVDREAIAWCRQHLLGRYELAPTDPPTSLASRSFDLIYSISVFTHLSEARQRAWLEELRRLLRPKGLLVLSTHSPDLAWTRPDLSPEQHRALAAEGTLFAPSGRGFNDDSAFHSEDYLRRVWGRLLDLRCFRAHGLGGYQDLSVWSHRS